LTIDLLAKTRRYKLGRLDFPLGLATISAETYPWKTG